MLGVFGGTFNPIHVGHLRAAEEVLEALDLERVLFVPSRTPPHKTADGDDPIASAKLRADWVRLAIADNPRFALDPVEVERDGASYLVDTLRSFGERLAPERPVFIVGSDAFSEMGTWREPDLLFALAHYAVMVRPGVAGQNLGDWLPREVSADVELAADGRSGRHGSSGCWQRLIEITGFDVSASDVRRRLREGRSVRYLLSDTVREAVLASGVYAAR